MALQSGRLAGEAELVATGRRVVIQNAEDLIALLQDDRRSAAEFLSSSDGPPTPGAPADS